MDVRGFLWSKCNCTDFHDSHHLVYILLLAFVVIPNKYSSLFALCCILELPTFILAAGSLNPALRNDYVCATSTFSLKMS